MAEAARKVSQEDTARGGPVPSARATSAARPMPGRAFDNSRSTLLSPRAIQPSLRVSQPSDAAEREADRVAAAVVSMPGPAPDASHRAGPALHRRATASQAPGDDRLMEAEVRKAAAGGTALPARTRGLLEPRFRASFANVRIHTDANAAKLSARLAARAFTFGNHIFFAGGAYDPDSKSGLELLAHELTHTIQQGETIQRKADPVAAQVTQRIPRQASRLGISDALHFFADAANAIPGYRMFTILLGVNPIDMTAVEASPANILRAIVEFLPGGFVISRVLDAYGVFDRAGNWISNQLKSLGITGASIKAAIDRFLGTLGWRDLFDLGGVWNRAKAIFTEPITRIIAFVRALYGELKRIVWEAVLRPLAALAEGTAGYPLLKAVLGVDPVTGEAVPRNADTVIGGFMTLIGQDELYQNIKRANAGARAWAWFQGALGGLMGLVRSIPTRFMALLHSLEIMDFVVLPRAFGKVALAFGSFVADFGRWALGTVFDLAKIIVEVVAPGAIPYIQRAAGAFRTIVRDPIRFVRTLVAAAMQGFRQFAANFLTHLRASLVGWLTGAMAGANIYIPQGFSLREILKFVLSVLGLTWTNIRAKLVRATNETVVTALETGFEIVRVLVTEGPAAAWQRILETLGNLRDMVIEQVMEFVRSRVVQAAVTRLLSMLSPAGALIQAIIAIYNTIMFFVERLRQIAAVAASFIDSIATIASGNIGPAANRVEQTMAGLLTLVISFLARIAGLGRVADAVTNIIARVRAPIDRALDRVVAWIVEQARRVGRFLMRGARSAAARIVSWWRVRRSFRNASGQTHSLYFTGQGRQARLMMASNPRSFEQVLADTTLTIPDRAARQADLTRINGMIAARAENQGTEAEQTQFQTQIERELTTLAGHLAAWLDHDPDLPVSTVTWGANAGRPSNMRAEPLTRNAGNTTGGAATGDRSHAVGFALVSRWDQPTPHLRFGGTVTVNKSRVTAAHLLHHGLHGPYTAAWNVALADQGLNNAMASLEGRVVTAVNGGAKVQYTVSITYWSNQRPPANAMTDEDVAPALAQSWVDYYTAREAQVSALAWAGSSYSRSIASGSARGNQTPVRGTVAASMETQVLGALNAALQPSNTITIGGRRYVATTFTSIAALTRAVARNSNRVGAAVGVLTGNGSIAKPDSRSPYYVRQ